MNRLSEGEEVFSIGYGAMITTSIVIVRLRAILLYIVVLTLLPEMIHYNTPNNICLLVTLKYRKMVAIIIILSKWENVYPPKYPVQQYVGQQYN